MNSDLERYWKEAGVWLEYVSFHSKSYPQAGCAERKGTRCLGEIQSAQVATGCQHKIGACFLRALKSHTLLCPFSGQRSETTFGKTHADPHMGDSLQCYMDWERL